MFRKAASAAVGALAIAILFSASGCQWTAFGPSVNWGPYFAPVPLSPFVQDELEDKAWEKERYDRVPILGPITSGGPPVALDPPSDDEIMRALEKADPIEGGLPFLHEVQRSNVKIIPELVADYVDPPRVYPMIGPAQLHHAHYKCTIHYTKTTRVGWPVPHTNVDEDAREVIYVDHNHLHMVGNVDGGVGAEF